MTVLCHSAVIYFKKTSQTVTSRKVVDARKGSHAAAAHMASGGTFRVDTDEGTLNESTRVAL